MSKRGLKHLSSGRARFPLGRETAQSQNPIRPFGATQCWTHFVCSVCLALSLTCFSILGQQTTGTIQGIAQDTSGGVLPGTAITITDPRNGRRIEAIANGSGLFVVRSLPASDYEVRCSLAGFKTQIQQVLLNVGSVATANCTLPIGEITETFTVRAAARRIDTATHVVSGVVSSREIEEMPLNGRNFLDVAQIEPGVQLVDGRTFDPTKNQMVGVSIGGRKGRTTRITVDGIDITDEIVGTTVQNLSPDAVQEFALSQASLDPSTGIGSSGAINIITKRGGNQLHGSAFFYYRDNRLAALPTTRAGSAEAIQQLEEANFDQKQYGFHLGGPVIKDRLFFFLGYENIAQNRTTFINSVTFPVFNRAVTTPFDDQMAVGRLDWNLNDQISSFFRLSHESNQGAAGFGATRMAPFVNQNVSTILGAGLDVATARLTHSFRYGHTSYDNEIESASLDLPVFRASDGQPVGVTVRSLVTGPSAQAPQNTYQTVQQWKYDGAWVSGRHTIRYGGEVGWIKANAMTSFCAEAPRANLSFTTQIRQAIIERGDDPQDPLQYPVRFALISNGQGAFSEIANLGRDKGGINNTRLAWYVADAWRIRPRLNLNLGLRWEVNTGQVNDDLGLPAELIPLLGEGGVKPTRLDTNNFGPQIGFAWQPFSGGTTVIRGGAGIYYATQIFNTTLYDRAGRLPTGSGLEYAVPPFFLTDEGGRVLIGGKPVNNINTWSWINQPLKDVLDQVAQTAQDAWSVGNAQQFDPANPAGALTGGFNVFVQDYTTPYGIQTNLGIQQAIATDWTLSADFARNRSVHHNLSRDVNRWQAADNLDVAEARRRISQTLAQLGLDSVDQFIQAGLPFSRFGLGSLFGTQEPNLPAIPTILTSGLASYTALQIRSTARLARPLPGVHDLFLNVGYALSRYAAAGLDQDAFGNSGFNDNYLSEQAFGPADLDRTNQLSAQLYFEIPGRVRLNFATRWGTALPVSAVSPQVDGGFDEIFYTDFNGDGTIGDFLPGTRRGAVGRDVSSVNELNRMISSFNSGIAGSLTPAGRALVNSGLFSEAQLRALNVVVQPIAAAPADQVMNDSFVTTDLRITRSFEIADKRLRIEPMVEVFNLFNVANYGLMGGLNGLPGSLNGTPSGLRSNLVGLGSGSFAQGIPRAFQLAVRIRF